LVKGSCRMHPANRRRLYPGDGRLAAPAGHPEWPSVFLVSRKPATPGKIVAFWFPRSAWERGRVLKLLPLGDFGVSLVAVQILLGLLDHVVDRPGLLLDVDGRVIGELAFQLQRLAFDLEPVFKIGDRLLDLAQAATVEME